MHRARLPALLLALLAGCATFAPPQFGTFRAPEAQDRIPSAKPAAVALVGDVGAPVAETGDLVNALADRLLGSPDAPVLVLGDVFYTDGLLGLCPEKGEPPRSKRGCQQPSSPEEQLTAVFEPYRERLPGRRVVAVAGNHDHYGDPRSTVNACSLFPGFAPGWSYLSHDCGLGGSDPVRTVDLGAVVLFVLDSERMIRDSDERGKTVAALRREILRYRDERPEAWRVLATHHPLESYGLHNGAHPLTALHKDLYWLTRTALLPLSYPLERWFLRNSSHQNVYEWRYRSFRRALYAALREAPVDLVVSGHDHSLQLIRVDHPGVGYQLVSGSGAYRTPVKRWGLDLLFLNRLARGVGLRDRLPAPSHRLLFAGSGDSNLGFAVLAPGRKSLVVEIYGSSSPEPLVVHEITR